MSEAKELRKRLANAVQRHGEKLVAAANDAEAKLPALAERDRAREERAQARGDALKAKYPAIKKEQ